MMVVQNSNCFSLLYFTDKKPYQSGTEKQWCCFYSCRWAAAGTFPSWCIQQ